MYGRHPLTGSLEINAAESITDDDRSRKMQELDRATLPPPLDATRRSWLLEPPQPKKKKYVDLGCILVSRKIFLWTLGAVLVTTLLAGSITMIVRHMPHHKPTEPKPDNYTVALRKALMFFNAQKSGKLPEHNNVTWRGDSCMQDGKDQTGGFYKDLVGGYYDAGDATKFNFPMSYAMTMLSWSVIEYSAKYKAAGELDHVKELIKWGTDYFLETFNSSADTIDVMVEQVGSGHDDHYCWMRPEDIDNERIVTPCYGSCSHLGAEMAAALASASIVFKDNRVYSQKLVHGAKTLYKYADFVKDKNNKNQSREFYKSSLFWDELLWGGAWLYYATGNVTYLDHVTSHDMARKAGAFWNSPDYGVSSWDNKLPGAQLLLMRLRLFMSPGFPYEDILSTFHNQTGVVMCSYLPYFTRFKRTKGGLIQLNHGEPQPLQYAATAAFLAALYSDYLDAADTPGWYCGPNFYSTHVLRDFTRSQIDYILGKNPQNMSYVVDFGQRYPRHVHHKGASIPKSVKKESCKGGWKWRDTKRDNPNTIVGAMVAGPDKHDEFHDLRSNYNYTEPTLAGNAGLVAALVALSGEETLESIDKNTIFSAVPPLTPATPPPPAPWSMDTLEREKTLKKLKIIEFAWDRRKAFYAFYYTSKMAEEENSLEYTPTWVVAFICFIIVLLSLLAERGLHHLGKYLKRRKQDALFEALQKLKEELMLLGFISLLLTVSQTAIRHICVPPALVSNMFPCKKPLEEEHHAPETSHSLVFNTRHLLSTGASPDHCTTKGKVPLISVEALHHLHIFIFVLAVIHVIFCASTMVLGGARIQQWKRWEDNFRKIPSQKDASKPGHAHAHHAHAHAHAHALHELFNANHEFFKMHAGGFWRRSVVISWLRSFCKQFYGSVTKSEYIALRHGFIMTHCPTNPSFNFHKYMLRTVEMDFKKVVTISWYLWLFVVVFLLLNVGGWNTYFWLSFLPLILLLMVGAKLENIISSLAVDVCEKRNRGEQAVITPSDELFWFHRPEIVLQLVHFILFQNSFEIAFFFWILFTYGIHSCIMEKLGFLIPRLVMGVLVQVLCSYSTLPLYALVTQMGSKFKKGIFDELVHSTLEVWLSDTRNKGESTSEAHRMEIEPTIPESFNVQVNELMECDNP